MSSVKLINYSQPPTEKGSVWYRKTLPVASSNIKDQVAHCARVSNPSNQHNTDTSSKLLTYLMKHKHWSPFEMVSICLEIDTTRDIARQILRHRSFSFQEFSQRYADPTGDLGFSHRDARLQDTKNRQNSIELDERDSELQELFLLEQAGIIKEALESYNWAIEQGIAKEQARAFLPEGLTNSRMYMNGTLRSWIHYIELRTGPETQSEHREIALLCAEAIEPVFSDIMQFVNNS